MTKQKRLKVVGPSDTKLGRPTIMDRALAQRYGSPYVHLAVLAIDIDRVREIDREDGMLPFGWEVFLTERGVLRMVDTASADPTPLLEDTVLSVMDLPRPAPGAPAPFGSQLPFAVYTALARGLLPNPLGNCFRSWKKPPLDLVDEIRRMEADPGLCARLAQHCLNAPVTPPLVQPARDALSELSA